MKSLKTVGLACIVALALTATLGIASASASQFRSEAYPVKFDGEQNNPEEKEEMIFTVKAPTGAQYRTICSTYHLSGTASEASSGLSLAPSASGCKFSGQKVTFNPHSCKYVLHSTSESAPYTGTMDVACSHEGDEIEILNAGSGCKIGLPAQSGLGSIGFSNSGKGNGRTVAASFNLTGLTYTASGACLGQMNGTYKNGTLTGPNTLKGTDEAGTFPMGVYLANEQVEDPPHFNAESYSAHTNGEAEEPKFSLKIGNLKCGASKFIDGIYGPAAGLSAWTEISGCSFGGNVFVSYANGCEFTYTLSGEAANTAGMGLVCPAGAFFELKTSVCLMRIPAQQLPGAVKFENTGSGSTRKVTLNVSVSTLKYELFECWGTSGTFTNGGFTAAWQVSGTNMEGGPLGLWIG